ncbi:MAG: PAS domain-containing protein [Proteobacteria bacterium]|nr:PAS domain-containing protein [Pseudomonadota bacterium]
MSFVKSPFAFFKAKSPDPAPADEREVADWSPECEAFLKYWSSLRRNDAIPTSEDFLDSPSSRFAAHSYILELLDGAPVVRLQGTQLEQAWARDLTGGDFFPGRSPHFRAAALANMNAALTHPCGHLARSTYATSKGRKITSDWIQLPLGVRPGRAPRIVGAVFQHTGRNFGEVATHHFELHKLAWLDAGWGVPAQEPTPLAP